MTWPKHRALYGDVTQVDLVSIGCPHASATEIRQVAERLAGRRVKTALWVTTARKTRQSVPAQVATIEAAGGRVVADTCMVVAPVQELGFRTMATNSAKMAFYSRSHSGLRVRFGTLDQCITAAISGEWRGRTPGVSRAAGDPESPVPPLSYANGYA